MIRYECFGWMFWNWIRGPVCSKLCFVLKVLIRSLLYMILWVITSHIISKIMERRRKNNLYYLFPFDTQFSQDTNEQGPCQRLHGLRFEPGTAANWVVFKAQGPPVCSRSGLKAQPMRAMAGGQVHRCVNLIGCQTRKSITCWRQFCRWLHYLNKGTAWVWFRWYLNLSSADAFCSDR